MIVNGGVVCGRSGNGYDRLRSIFFFDKRFFVSGQCEFSCSAANYPAEVVTSSRLPGILMVDHGAPPVMRSIKSLVLLYVAGRNIENKSPTSNS